MTGPTRFILAAMGDGASLDDAVALAGDILAGQRVVLAHLRGGRWIGSPFDWIPTMRTLRAAILLRAGTGAPLPDKNDADPELIA